MVTKVKKNTEHQYLTMNHLYLDAQLSPRFVNYHSRQTDHRCRKYISLIHTSNHKD